jgi:predicted dehydrogenase
MKKINFAIIGLGQISKYYIAAFKKNKNAELVMVCDLNESCLSSFKSKNVVKTKDIDTVLSYSLLDAVIITTPNHTHKDIIQKCLESNINVLCEKPLTFTPDETKQLIRLSEKQSLILKTAFHRKFNKNLKLFKKKLPKVIKKIEVNYCENILEHSSGEKWYLNNKLSGGGCLMDNGINVVNYLEFLFGKLKLIQAKLFYVSGEYGKYDIKSNIKLSCSRGDIEITLSWDYQGEKKDIVLTTNKDREITLNFLKGYKKFKSSLYHEYELLLKDYCTRIITRKNEPDKECLSAIKMIDSIYKKSEKINL